MSILVSVRILSLFDLIHFLIFFNIAGAPPFVKGGFHPCTCVVDEFTDRRSCGPRYWCQDHETAQECDVLFIINLNLK
jgi:hypothetical protein